LTAFNGIEQARDREGSNVNPIGEIGTYPYPKKIKTISNA